MLLIAADDVLHGHDERRLKRGAAVGLPAIYIIFTRMCSGRM